MSACCCLFFRNTVFGELCFYQTGFSVVTGFLNLCFLWHSYFCECTNRVCNNCCLGKWHAQICLWEHCEFLMCVAMISQGRVWAGSTFSSGAFFCAPLPPSYDFLTAGFLPFRLVEIHLPFFFSAHFSKICLWVPVSELLVSSSTPFGAPRTRPETHPSA